MLKWLRIFVAAALFLSGVWLGYSLKKSPQNPLPALVAGASQIVNHPGQVVTQIVAKPVSYAPGKEGKTKYRLGVSTSLDKFEVRQVTFSYRAYQRLWIDAGYDVKHRAALLGVSLEF